MYACQKFHNYIYGRNFHAENDKKPLYLVNHLIYVHHESKDGCYIYIQRYRLHLYYLPGREMMVADAITRATVTYVHMILYPKPILNQKLKEVKMETSRVINYVEIGWPNAKVIGTARPYFNLRDTLSISNGFLMKGTWIIIPQSHLP